MKKALLWILTHLLALGVGAFIVWSVKPINEPLWCAKKGLDALAVITRVTIEQAENWILAGVGVLALIPMYGIWRCLAVQKSPHQGSHVEPVPSQKAQ